MVMARYISVLLTLLTSYFTWAQKPYAEIIVEPRNVEVGEQFNVIVKSNISGQIEITLPDEFEQGYNVISRMEQDYDGNTGQLTTFFYHGRTGSLSKAGKYTFGPALIKKGNHVYRSNKVTVKASEETSTDNPEISSNLLRKPAFGIIELSKQKVYVGEAFTAQCKIYSQFKPTHFDSYQSFLFNPAGDQHKLGENIQPVVDIGMYGNAKRHFFEHDKQVIFLNSPGKVSVEPFEISLQAGFQEYQVTSKKNHVQVLPLPKGAPSSFTGGVGEFNIQCNTDKTKVKQGDMLTFTLIISGLGNLHDINRPKVNFGDYFEIYGDPEIKEKFSFSSRGADGEIQIIYHLQAIKDGEGKFAPIVLSYFDPVTAVYKTVKTQATNITVTANPDFVVENKPSKETQTAKIDRFNTPESKASTAFFASTTFKVIGVSLPLCAALLFLFFRKRKEEEDEVKPTIAAKSEPVVQGLKTGTAEFLSTLQSHANNGNALPFFTQLSSDLRKATSQAAMDDADWVLSTDDVKAFFAKKDFSQEFQEEYFTLQQTCELCRYGCQQPEDDLTIYLARAKRIFETLENS